MKKDYSINKIMVFAGSYVATIIGSGFATGQEIMQFFSFYGLAGLMGAVVSLIIFAFLGAESLERGRLVKPKDSMKIYTLYTGKYVGKFLDYFVPFFLFGVFVVMISGAGATLSEYYGLNPYIGRVGMAIISLVSVFFGLDKLSGILGKIGPIIIVFTIFVGVVGLVNNFQYIPESIEFLKTAQLSKPAPNAIFSGVLYAAYNVIIIIGFLASLGGTTENRKDAILGGLLGAFSLMLAATVMFLAIFSRVEVLFAKSIPTLVIADGISPIVGKVFSIVLIMGIYSTAAPLLWQCSNRFSEDGSKKFKVSAIIITVLGLLGGLLPFDKLVGTIYPYTGYLGIVVILMVCYKVFSLKKSGKTGKDEMEKIESR